MNRAEERTFQVRPGSSPSRADGARGPELPWEANTGRPCLRGAQGLEGLGRACQTNTRTNGNKLPLRYTKREAVRHREREAVSEEATPRYQPGKRAGNALRW